MRRSAWPSRRAFIGSSLWHQRYRFPQQIWLADYRAIRQFVESFLRLVIAAVFLPPYFAAGRIKRRTSSRGGDDHYLLPVSTGPACQYSGAMRSCAPVILLVPSSPPGPLCPHRLVGGIVELLSSSSGHDGRERPACRQARGWPPAAVAWLRSSRPAVGRTWLKPRPDDGTGRGTLVLWGPQERGALSPSAL